MRRRSAMLALTVIASGLVLLHPTAGSRAQAAPHEVCAGFGQASYTSPFVYPVIGQADGDTAPPFGITASPHAAGFTFHLSAPATCVPSGTTISASGTVHGWCGLSVGAGVSSMGDRFHLVGIGSTLLVTGELTGLVNLTPNVIGGDNCLTGADTYLANGAVVRSSCTVGMTSVTLTSVGLPTTTQHLPPGDIASVESHGNLHVQAGACL